MIKITIEKTVTEEYTETVNLIVKRTPTEHRERKSSYGDDSEKVVFVEESSPQEIKKWRERTIKLLEQQIQDDSELDLAAVIKAINKL